jgi:hypothetical protein
MALSVIVFVEDAARSLDDVDTAFARAIEAGAQRFGNLARSPGAGRRSYATRTECSSI